MKKILISYQIPKEGLIDLCDSFDVTYPDKQALSYDEILSLIPEYEGLLAAGIKVDRTLLEAAKKLRIISNYGVGYDNIDVACATGRGVVVANTPHSVTEATAEIAIGLMYAVMRRISECDARLRHNDPAIWGMMNNRGYALYGKTRESSGWGGLGGLSHTVRPLQA